MNSSTAKVLARWKYLDGKYLLQPAMAAGQPATLLGYPVLFDESMPDARANAHPILFGDFAQGYPVADAGGIRVTLDDSITMPGRVKWYIRRRVGGIVADQSAVCAIKCAVS